MPKLSAISTSSTSASQVDLQILQGALERWPLSHRFPLLDVYRLACAAAQLSPKEPATFALQAAQWSSPWPSNAEEAKTRRTLSLLALRAVCNVLSTSLNSSLTQVSRHHCLVLFRVAHILSIQILSELQKGQHFSGLAKPARVAYVTVLFK